MYVYTIASELDDEDKTVISASVVADKVDDAVKSAKDAWDAALIVHPQLGPNPFVPSLIISVNRSVKVNVVDAAAGDYNEWEL